MRALKDLEKHNKAELKRIFSRTNPETIISSTTSCVSNDAIKSGQRLFHENSRICFCGKSNYQLRNNCYYDVGLADKCHKFLRQQSDRSRSAKILLHPEEEWAESAPGIQWDIKVSRWWKHLCTVTEHRVGRATSAPARIIHNSDGTITVRGSFKRITNPDFRLHLNARVDRVDFERGYLMTGALQLGDMKGEGRLKITHFAVLPRY